MDRFVAAACAWIAFVVPCFSQDAPARNGSARGSLLVLNNGRVVTGSITRRPDGYDVKTNVGRLFIAATTVRFEASDMADAYRKMRASFKEFTPSVHIEIARWCLKNQQIPAARQELLDALRLEPRNETALLILKRLERDAAPPAPPKTTAQDRINRYREGVKHESLGGLTEKQAGIFTSKVQPILERRCGNASCHGSQTTSDFQLKRTRGRSSTYTAQRNLAVVLQQIDLKGAENSPLVRVFNEPHTRDGRPLFPGKGGLVQRKIVLDWVNSVARKADRPSSATDNSTAMKKSAAAAITAATRTVTDTEKQLVKEVRLSNEHDPFDPAEFNRKHHGRGTTQGK